MSIERTAPAAAIAADPFARESGTVRNPHPLSHSKPVAEATVTRVEISHASRQRIASETQDVDNERVAAIQQALAAGDYQIDHEQIAAALVRNIIQG